MKTPTIPFKSIGYQTILLISFLILNVNSWGQSPIDSSRIVRVLTFNIYHGETMKGDFDLNLIADVIKSVSPDLVALQEVDFNTNRAKNMDLATELGQRTGLVSLFGQAMFFDGGGYGVGILSAYPFIKTRSYALPSQHDREPRTALEAQIILNTIDTIRFVSSHLDNTRDEADKVRQAKKLNELFADDNILSILAGDLNARPESETIKILFNEWKPSFADFTPTAPSINPRAKIDYILFRPANRWRVLETRVIDEEVASDHRPVLSVLELLD